MTINSFYAVNILKAVIILGRQAISPAMNITVPGNPHWIELCVGFACSHLRTTPRTNFNYVSATGNSSGNTFSVSVSEDFVA